MREAFYPLNKDESVISKPTLYSFYSDLIYFFSMDSAAKIVNKHKKATDEQLIRSLVSDFGEYVVEKIYIMMTLSGYGDVYLNKPLSYEYFDGKYDTYLSIVKDLSGFYTKSGYDYDDYFSLLCDCLCIMGDNNIKRHGLYKEKK